MESVPLDVVIFFHLLVLNVSHLSPSFVEGGRVESWGWLIKLLARQADRSNNAAPEIGYGGNWVTKLEGSYSKPVTLSSPTMRDSSFENTSPS